MYIIEAAEPLSIFFLFFLIIGGSPLYTNYFLQIFLKPRDKVNKNFLKKTLTPLSSWSQIQKSLAGSLAPLYKALKL
jgi:hypothetical protein